MPDPIVPPERLHRQTALALDRFARKVTSSLELTEVLNRIAMEVTKLLGGEGAAIVMPKDEGSLWSVAAYVPGLDQSVFIGITVPIGRGLTGYVMQTGDLFWLNGQGSSNPAVSVDPEVERKGGIKVGAMLAVPMLQDGRPIGVIQVAHRDPAGLSADDLPVLIMAANWAAIAVSNAQLHEQARNLREQQAALEERARLARELHDAVIESLYSMSVLSGAWRRQIEAGRQEPRVEQIAELDGLVRQALREIRLLVYELRPSELESEGLIGALSRRLEAVEARAGIKVSLTVMDEEGRRHPAQSLDRAMLRVHRLPVDVQLALYRITQEALNNILKHSEATSVDITIRLDETTFALEIVDDGRGFDVDSPAALDGFGLAGLRERAQQLGGTFHLESAPGRGATIRVLNIPCRPAGRDIDGAG